MKARKTLMSLCLLLALPLAAQQKNYVSEVMGSRPWKR